MNYIIKLIFTIIFFLSFSIAIAHAKSLNVIVLGDSLVAGYGLLKNDGFVNQLQNKINSNNMKLNLVNGGVSGETSSGLLNRLEWVLEEQFDGVIVSIGANDTLRGINPELTFQNINNILNYLKKNKIPSMLIGMKAPNNLGKDYVSEFNKIYPNLAKIYRVSFYPFFLKDVALVPSLNQDDMIHPNKKGIKKIVENIYPYFIDFYKTFKDN
ncbi:arylesterase [Candidatus Levibacter sp. Uisw_134_01]|uniref:arylesterase n=1 Tax=Candidatus Levibacter sp. Uisw_134_01 TaxID=3230999 RepID=UPI003D48B09F